MQLEVLFPSDQRIKAAAIADLEARGVEYDAYPDPIPLPSGAVFYPMLAVHGFLVRAYTDFTRDARLVLREVVATRPDLDERVIFGNSRHLISRRTPGSPTFGEWCEQRGIKYADQTVPEEWCRP
jgi:hypothetical protein